MKKLFLQISLFVYITGAFSQSLIQSGPMLGYSEMREVLIWIQTKSPAKVKAKYWVTTNSGTSYFTDEYQTQKDKAFTAKLIADQVQPDNNYSYEIYVNGKAQKFTYPLTFKSKPLWLYRKDAPDFKIALGSCAYVNDPAYDRPGEPYGGNYEIFTSIYQKKPDLMMWLGDNTYLRESDWDTQTGIFHRYTHTRSLPDMQPLLASTHHYAIWDDHDFGPNDSDGSFYNKASTRKTFELFWGNNVFGTNGLGSINSSFQWADCEFFLLDDRFYRTPNNLMEKDTLNSVMLGKEQSKWLIEALSASKSTFKFICVGGQFLNPSGDNPESFIKVKSEMKTILDAIAKNKVRGVMFLTGDRHFSDLTYLNREGTYTLYDFTVSPLGAKGYCPKNKEGEASYPRVEGSLLCNQRNFGMIEVSGNKEERQLRLVLYDVTGNEKFSKVIKAKDLK
ncbi:MAG: alkaline phosphatase D family protein [Bacteroidota bacterium]|nr:alkaline phosphatase D family protein [Bacteroidota bacterium]